MKKGLILEGGAMRGVFTAGVIDVMMENGICYDGIVGVSAGACFGCNYKSGQNGRTIRYNKKYCRDSRYCSFRSLVFTGDIFGAEFCYNKLPNELDVFDNEAYMKNPAEFHIVCTDVTTGKAVYRKMESLEGDEVQWVRASASMPLVSRIVEIEGKKLLDGGVADSIPLRYFQGLGYEKNVVVLTQPKGYVKSPNKMLPFIKRKYKKYPGFVEAVSKRHEVYNATTAYIAEQEAEGKIFVIRPEKELPVGHITHKPELLQEVYDTGRKTMEKRLESLCEYLSSEK